MMSNRRPDPSAGAGDPVSAVRRARTVAITYGTYDLFHVGHVRLFMRIKARFDRLIVAVSTDEFNAIKGKKFKAALDLVAGLGDRFRDHRLA